MEAIPIPFEQEDPTLGDLVARWVRGRGKTAGLPATLMDMKTNRMYDEIKQELRTQPRNAPCGCGSGQKAKKCCSALT